MPDLEHWIIVPFRFHIKDFFCEILEIWWDFLLKISNILLKNHTYGILKNFATKGNFRLWVKPNYTLQHDQINMAVFFWYTLSNVTCLVYASVHTYTGHFLYFLQGTRKTRPCLTGHPVPLGGGDIATTSSKLIESSAEFSSCNRLKSNLKVDFFV